MIATLSGSRATDRSKKKPRLRRRSAAVMGVMLRAFSGKKPGAHSIRAGAGSRSENAIAKKRILVSWNPRGRQTRWAPLPLVGRGWGWGSCDVAIVCVIALAPHPTPPRRRGEGAHRVCRSRVHRPHAGRCDEKATVLANVGREPEFRLAGG